MNDKATVEVEKTTMVASKKEVLDLVRKIEVLEREKRELEAEVCRAKKEKSEAIERIQNEMMALEADKRGFEAEIAERDEVIKVLAQENNCLKGLEMKINMLALKSMDVVQLSQHAHLTNNVVMLGQNSAGVTHSSKLNGSINHDAENSDAQYEDEMTHTHACKRKRPINKWKEPVIFPRQTNRCANGSKIGNVQVDQDLLAAFDVDSELCLRAICALYRQHQRLGHSTDTSLSDEGIAFAEYLMSEDPEGRKTKKMVAKLDEIDLDAVAKCISIAKRHYKQVFEIYKSKEDPVFLS